MGTTLRLWDGYDDTSPELRAEVRRLQQALRECGFLVAVDGFFGRGTEAAVEVFQRRCGLTPDGIVGRRTWAALERRPAAAEAFDLPDGGVYETGYARDHPRLLEDLTASEAYRGLIAEGAAAAGVPVAVVWGIGSRESRWGLALRPRGPGGTGDTIRRPTARPDVGRMGALPPDGGGFGRGLMQIDFDAHEFARTGPWRDPRQNILYGCKVLGDCQRFLARHVGGARLLRAALAGYNCGPGNVVKAIRAGRSFDYYTHGRNYGADVLSRAGWYQLQG